MDRMQAQDVKWLLQDFEAKLGREIDREKDLHSMDEGKLRAALREAYKEVREERAGRLKAEGEVRKMNADAAKKAAEHAARLSEATGKRDDLMLRGKELDRKMGELLSERTELMKERASDHSEIELLQQKVGRLDARVKVLEAEVAAGAAREEDMTRQVATMEAEVKDNIDRQHQLVGQLSVREDENRLLKRFADEEAPRLRAENAKLHDAQAARDAWEAKFNDELDASSKLKVEMVHTEHLVSSLKNEVGRLKMELFKRREAPGKKPEMA